MNANTRLALLARCQAHPLLASGVSLWFGHAPDEAALPVVLLSLDSDRELMTHSGPTGLGEAQLSVDVWAHDAASALSLRQAAIQQLNGFGGQVALEGGQVAHLTYCTHEASSEDYDAENNLAHASADFALGYRTG